MSLEEIKNWMKADKPVIIAGPCSAESEAQVLRTARQIKEHTPQVNTYRAGIWKPRTRPNSFEGVGKEGLGWLKKVKRETGMKTAVEVANANHVYECLKYSVDILWIGARTSVNPFSVQEIAEALRGVDVPIFVKNPINPDLALWIGALERLHAVGINQLAAIHRGFSTGTKVNYRNSPEWKIPIELKRQFPELPIICDPSHIAGRKDLLKKVSQKGLDLAMDGLMIETHENPEVALSDKEQQVTPWELEALLNDLIIRDVKASTPNLLEVYRDEIDQIDHELLEILAKRDEMIRKVGEVKRETKMTILQVKRWDHILKDRLAKGASVNLEENIVRDVFEYMHTRSIKIQEGILNEVETKV